MRRHLFGVLAALGALGALGAFGPGGTAWARHFEEPDPTPPVFLLTASPRIAGIAPAEPTPAYLAGSRIAAVGDRALAIDADSGALLLADATGAALAQLPIGRDAAMLAYDPTAKLAYVADRRGDRIVSVDVGDRLAVHMTWRTPHEPYGVALTPDRRTLIVTAIADRALVAYDVATGSQRWRTALDREPRGVAIGAATCSCGARSRAASRGSPSSPGPARQQAPARAPYFHDGSAATLEALLRERGAVHGMATSTQLTGAQIADLTAFLEIL